MSSTNPLALSCLSLLLLLSLLVGCPSTTPPSEPSSPQEQPKGEAVTPTDGGSQTKAERLSERLPEQRAELPPEPQPQDKSTQPPAKEVCNGLDDDNDGQTDEDDVCPEGCTFPFQKTGAFAANFPIDLSTGTSQKTADATLNIVGYGTSDKAICEVLVGGPKTKNWRVVYENQKTQSTQTSVEDSFEGKVVASGVYEGRKIRLEAQISWDANTLAFALFSLKVIKDTSVSTEICNGLDDNNDGKIDEDGVCASGCTFPISFTDPATTYQLGIDPVTVTCDPNTASKFTMNIVGRQLHVKIPAGWKVLWNARQGSNGEPAGWREFTDTFIVGFAQSGVAIVTPPNQKAFHMPFKTGEADFHLHQLFRE